MKNLKVVGIFSHFSYSDSEDETYSTLQNNIYKEIIDKIISKGVNEVGIKHFANSSTIIKYKDKYYDSIRPGLLLYGYNPIDNYENIVGVNPILSLKCRIINIKYIDKDKFIGYKKSFQLEKRSKIAILPIGYDDGYSRMLSNNISVIINDKVVPVIGKICMNFCMVNVDEIENVNVGDIATIYGNHNENNINTIAKKLNTSIYEVLCMINSKIPRIYV